MSGRRLRLGFDAAAWQPGRVALLAGADGEPPQQLDVSARALTLPYPDDAFAAIDGADTIRYVPEPLAFMQELHRIAAGGAQATFVLADGANDDAYSAAYLTKPYTPVSFAYFGQPAYYRADYGYRGDWDVLEALYVVRRERYAGSSLAAAREAIARERNQTLCFSVTLRAIKPIRPSSTPLAAIEPRIVMT